ncbi:hypothetical protein [Bradyrhizobium uaiense]|uniref:hypothetical protein n=1 Tax=Bradyrhizobium uaiense TaxID=2594946 RepID=UPI0013D08CCA|nr:hypothetical protein [Bradyrhizobium uaiense]
MTKVVNVSNLINLEAGRGFVTDFPLREQFEAALKSKNGDWFDFSFAKVDDDEADND